MLKIKKIILLVVLVGLASCAGLDFTKKELASINKVGVVNVMPTQVPVISYENKVTFRGIFPTEKTEVKDVKKVDSTYNITQNLTNGLAKKGNITAVDVPLNNTPENLTSLLAKSVTHNGNKEKGLFGLFSSKQTNAVTDIIAMVKSNTNTNNVPDTLVFVVPAYLPSNLTVNSGWLSLVGDYKLTGKIYDAVKAFPNIKETQRGINILLQTIEDYENNIYVCLSSINFYVVDVASKTVRNYFTMDVGGQRVTDINNPNEIVQTCNINVKDSTNKLVKFVF